MNKEKSIAETKRFFDEINDPELADKAKRENEKQERIKDAKADFGL